ncbi:uncharacterized protein JCM6883_004648 [Sporobolomyces salmoneus]|uniref:uncharacterized protein n=1 Tax=Sporobolomyces salmoneus TaxID=183962 RepID=UPI00317F1716
MSSSDPSSSSSFPSATELVDRVPLIKNPAFWVPPPVEVPLDIHPLPSSVEAYFVYPHTLESHVLSTLPSQLSQLSQKRLERQALLESYEESKERKRKQKLREIAPGWHEGFGGVMEPSRKKGTQVQSVETTTTTSKEEGTGEEGELLQESPEEMGDRTMEKAQRDQMMDWFDKWDGGEKSTTTKGNEEEGIDDLI